MNREKFEGLVSDALDGLPPQVMEMLDNVTVLVEGWPSGEQLRDQGMDSKHDLFGLYEGVPQSERGSGYHMALPDRITIFQGPLEAACATADELAHEVRATVVHELAHHFGWDDAEIEEMGY
ncbi:MAG: metallopeptidase family protein [Dehalococcoidia bacterium]|nr:metallopeptidase family protein [Dehalococcoidia bacterium]